MTTLGEDIRDVLVDIGTQVKVSKVSGEAVYREYIDFEVNTRTSNPFHREFFLETSFPFDSRADTGDVVEFIASGSKYIIMSKTPEIFEDAVIQYDNVVYRCNVSGELTRPVQYEEYSEHYVNTFSGEYSNCYGLITESNYDNEWNTNRDFGDYATRELFLYVPSHVGIQTEDRYSPVSGEYYRVGIVKKWIFPNTDIAVLHEDTREV